MRSIYYNINSRWSCIGKKHTEMVDFLICSRINMDSTDNDGFYKKAKKHAEKAERGKGRIFIMLTDKHGFHG
jgi:hypothetical protein